MPEKIQLFTLNSLLKKLIIYQTPCQKQKSLNHITMHQRNQILNTHNIELIIFEFSLFCPTSDKQIKPFFKPQIWFYH